MQREGTGGRVLLGDVARRAGVSMSTASRALAGDDRISAATRAAVRRAAADLHYIPNVAARGLRMQRTRTLGLLLVDFSDPIHGLVASGFEDEASRAGYRVIFAAGLADRAREIRSLELFTAHASDGVAIVSSRMDPAAARRRVPDAPLVLVQPDTRRVPRTGDAPEPGVVRTDDEDGMRAIVDHLVACGYGDIAYVGDGIHASDIFRRRATQRALASRRPGASVRWFSAPEDTWRAPDAVVATIAGSLPDVVVCFDDKLALALLDGFRRHGIGVPDDVGVVGFDGIPFAEISNPRLTTVVTPAVEMGRLAASLLVEAVRTGTMPAAPVMPVALAERESTRAATGAQGGVRPHG